jgi:hypothetical protein
MKTKQRGVRKEDCNGAATSQGMLAATRSWKNQGMDSPLEPPEETVLPTP